MPGPYLRKYGPASGKHRKVARLELGKGGVIMGIGLGEFIIVLLVAFIVVGPEDLPKVARTLARWIKAARRTLKDISGSFEENLEQEGLVQTKNSLQNEFKQANSELARIQQQVLDTARREEAAANPKG